MVFFIQKQCIIIITGSYGMSDYIFIFFTIFITTGLIYFLYKIMLGSEQSNKDSELQITHEDILEQINILYRQRKYNIVESLAKNYLSKKGGDDAVRAILTKSLYSSKKIYDAIEQAKIIIKHQPINFDMQIFLANCYLDVDKPMKAITVFQDILEEDPDNVVALKELSQAYYDTNQKRSAIKIYERLEDFIDSNQEKAKNKAIVAEIHAEFMEYDLAIKEYEQILEIYPDDVNVKKRLIELHKLTSDYDSLIELANEMSMAYAKDENGLWALKMLMETYKIMQNYEKALEYANLVKSHSLASQMQADEDIAKILFDEGKTEASIELLKSLVNKSPENIGLKKLLARAYEVNKNFDLAANLYKKILDAAKAEDIKQIHFEISSLYSNWAMYLFSQNDIEECFKNFTTALKYDPQNPDLYYRLGNINKIIKNYNETVTQYKRAIELDSQNPDYYYALAECYEEMDSIYEEKKALSESLKYNAQNAKVHYKLGVIYELQNDQSNAMAHINKAVELDENFVEAKHKLALMLEHIGDKEGAIRLYEDILNIEPENEEALNNLKMLDT